MSKNKKKNKNRQSRPPAKRPGAAARPTEAESSERRERKEEARQRRQRELRRIQRRQAIQKAAIVGGSIAAVALVILFVFRSNTPKAPTSGALRTLIAKAPAEAQAAGCGAVKDIGTYVPSDQNHAHIGTDVPSAPALSTYTSIPPVSGPHDPTTTGAGVYTTAPDIYKTIHSLEHGAVVLWYGPSVPQSALTADVNFVKQYQDHTILASYSYPSDGAAGSLPSGTQFVLTSWQKMQTCKSVPGTAVVADFLSKYRWPTLGGGTFQGSSDPGLEKGSPI